MEKSYLISELLKLRRPLTMRDDKLVYIFRNFFEEDEKSEIINDINDNIDYYSVAGDLLIEVPRNLLEE